MRALIGGGGQITVAAPGIPPFVSALAQGVELKATSTYAVWAPRRHGRAGTDHAARKICGAEDRNAGGNWCLWVR